MYANVIVDISHEKLDKTFQYLVPAGLENEIEPGVCVEIPFGNRKITGYVVEITENPEFDVDKIKPLCNIVKAVWRLKRLLSHLRHGSERTTAQQ